MGTGLASAVQLLFSLYIYVMVLRLLMHVARVDFFNPITQGILKATDPLVRPVQKIIKPMARFDLATFLVAFVLQLVAFLIIQQLIGMPLGSVVPLLAVVLASLFSMVVKIYFFALIISIILSWVAPQANHPGAILVFQLTEPLLAPVRRILPSLGGLDISPIFVFLGLQLAEQLVNGLLLRFAGGYSMGLMGGF